MCLRGFSLGARQEALKDKAELKELQIETQGPSSIRSFPGRFVRKRRTCFEITVL